MEAGIWHKRLGHISERGLKALVSRGKIPKLLDTKLELCEDNVLGKQNKVSFSATPRSRKMKKLELMHTDIWGLTSISSMAGSSPSSPSLMMPLGFCGCTFSNTNHMYLRN